MSRIDAASPSAGPDAPEASPEQENGAQGEPPRVLVVEDNPTNQKLMGLVLQKFGFEVAAAMDGEEGVAEAKAQRFDIVLMDLHMPRMDGYAAARAIRELPAPAGDVPILAVTADARAGVERAVRDAGMNGCMTKPVEFTLLEQEIDKLVVKRLDQSA